VSIEIIGMVGTKEVSDGAVAVVPILYLTYRFYMD